MLLAMTAVLVLAIAGLALARSAEAEVVYNNTPSSLNARLSSYGFAAVDFDELGSLVKLGGTARTDPQVNVLMSVYSCESGSPSDGSCSTVPGTKFGIPITVRLYTVGPNQEPGTIIGTETVEQQLTYRPSADPGCTVAPYAGGFKNGAGECVNGQLEPVTFQLAGATLPNEVIVSVSYNTSTSGYGQKSPTGGPADSLNVALAGPASVGTTLRETEGSYFASGAYGSANDVFEYQADEEAGESEGLEPAISITASPAAIGSTGTGAPAPSGTNGTTGTAPAGQGSVALKRKMSLKFISGKSTVSGSQAAVKVRCLGTTAKRCVGVLKLTVDGTTAKVSYSVAAGKKATLKVPLGAIDLSSAGAATTAAAVARTTQSSGGATTTKRTLHLG